MPDDFLPKPDRYNNSKKRADPTMVTDIQSRVANATVIVQTKERGTGQGVLVHGSYVLTAAHCVDWDHEGPMVLGDHFIQKIRTASGKDLIVSPYAVEPVSDIAVLGTPDGQVFYKESVAFEEFCENTLPVSVSTDTYDFGVWFPVSVLSHLGNWISAHAVQYPGDGHVRTLHIKTDEPTICGTSGGPIISEKGELVGVFSNSGGSPTEIDIEQQCGHTGPCPRPHLTLPVWVWQAILKATIATGEESDR